MLGLVELSKLFLFAVVTVVIPFFFLQISFVTFFWTVSYIWLVSVIIVFQVVWFGSNLLDCCIKQPNVKYKSNNQFTNTHLLHSCTLQNNKITVMCQDCVGHLLQIKIRLCSGEKLAGPQPFVFGCVNVPVCVLSPSIWDIKVGWPSIGPVSPPLKIRDLSHLILIKEEFTSSPQDNYKWTAALLNQPYIMQTLHNPPLPWSSGNVWLSPNSDELPTQCPEVAIIQLSLFVEDQFTTHVLSRHFIIKKIKYKQTKQEVMIKRRWWKSWGILLGLFCLESKGAGLDTLNSSCSPKVRYIRSIGCSK